MSTDSMPMHIVHVVPGLHIGGAETMLLQAVRALPAPVYAHTVIDMQSGGALASLLKAAGARVVHLGMRRGRPTLAGLQRLVRAARAEPVDIVQGWMYHGNLGASAFASLAKHKPGLVWSIHMHSPEAIESTPTRMVARTNATLSKSTDAVVYVAKAAIAAHTRAGFCADKAVYIPGGVDTQTFMPRTQARLLLRQSLRLEADARIVALIARFHPAKDHATFLRAAQRFTERAPQATHFVIVGEGLQKPPAPLRPLVAQSLQNRVHWLGPRNDIEHILQGSDVCTLSSAYSEALPRILLEAMACETACVATDLGDCATLLHDVGWIAPPRDAQALCDAWSQALTCPVDVLEARRRRGRVRVEAAFSLTQMGQEFAALYARIRNAHRA